MASRTALLRHGLAMSRGRTNFAYRYSTARSPALLGAEHYSSPFTWQQHRFKSSLSLSNEQEKKREKGATSKRSKPYLLDLGIPSLVPEWKKMFDPKTLATDISAGLTVGCIAIPLSLAIAMASGVPAEVGLATAAVSGVAGGVMGGTTLAVTGPAAAISLLVLEAVQTHGLVALPLITASVGGLQLASGVTRLGIYGKLVPVSVIAGFTTGVGALILSGQIPKALGMTAPAGLNPVEIAGWLSTNIGDMSPEAAALAFGTAAAMYALPKVHPKIPAALLAVGGATAATHMFGLDVDLIGTLPSGLEAFPFAMPVLPPVDQLPGLVRTTLLIYLMTTVESLLSCVALDKMKKTDYKHNPDQELIGQGVANLGAGLFMGMPVTSVIARSSLNQRVGAQTRLPALVQAGFVFGGIAFAGSSIAMIPMPALSGMLVFTGANMLYPSEFNYCYSVDKFTTLPFFTTVAGILSMGLAEGIGIGCATALGLAVQKNMELRIKMQVLETSGDYAVTGKMAPVSDSGLSQDQTKMQVLHTSGDYAVPGKMVCQQPGVPTTITQPLLIKPTSTVYQVRGPVNFLSMFEIDNMAEDIEGRSNPEDPIVLDLRYVTTLDFTGVEELVGRVIEAAEGAEIQSVTCRDDINRAIDRVDKERRISRYSSLELIE